MVWNELKLVYSKHAVLSVHVLRALTARCTLHTSEIFGDKAIPGISVPGNRQNLFLYFQGRADLSSCLHILLSEKQNFWISFEISLEPQIHSDLNISYRICHTNCYQFRAQNQQVKYSPLVFPTGLPTVGETLGREGKGVGTESVYRVR